LRLIKKKKLISKCKDANKEIQKLREEVEEAERNRVALLLSAEPEKELEDNRPKSQAILDVEEEKLAYQTPLKPKLRPNSFEIMQPLGAGAFGQVWLVKNKNNNEILAMKVIDKERLVKDDLMPYANTEKNIMLYIQHPFIIALKHSFQTPEKFFLLMEY